MPWVTCVLLHYRIDPLKPWRIAPIHQLRKRQVPLSTTTTTSSRPRNLLIDNRIRIPQKHPNTIKMPYPISQSAPSASLLIPPANPSTQTVCIKGQKNQRMYIPTISYPVGFTKFTPPPSRPSFRPVRKTGLRQRDRILCTACPIAGKASRSVFGNPVLRDFRISTADLRFQSFPLDRYMKYMEELEYICCLSQDLV